MNINAPDFTKLNWQFNVALIGATFCVFSLIYNDQYIYLGFLTFLYGIISQAIMPSIEMYFPEKDKWRNFLIGQGFLTMLWIYFSLQSYIEVSFDSKIISTGILFSGLSAISAFAAAIAAISSYKLTKDSRSSEVHKMFLDLMLKYDFTRRNDQDYLDNYWFGRVCDFFEFVCGEVLKGKLKAGDIDLFKKVMKQKEYIQYAKTRNKEDRASYENYLKWLL